MRMRMVGGYFYRLPCEILHNIVMMLPFDSIIQLRRSCKFWYNCLTDTNFVDLQLTHALQNSRGCLFVAYGKNGRNEGMYTVEQSGAHLNDLTTSKIFNYKIGRSRYSDFQSSGGLICVFSRESMSFRIFNPHIGQEIKVLDVPKFKECHFLQWWFFSYLPSTKEYKILKIGIIRSEDERRNTSFQGNVAAITTLGSNIWWEIKNVPTFLPFSSFVECQGELYWMKMPSLFSFDFVSEKFQEIPGPPNNPVHVHVIRNSYGRVIVNDKLISMGHTVGYVKDCRLWVLEDKTKGIWINKYDFSIPPLHKYARGLGCISGNGGLFGFIHDSTSVFSQDMRRTSFTAIETKLDLYISEEATKHLMFIAPHVRSLVSPVRVLKIGSKQIYDHSDHMDINLKKKWVLETLKLDYDASEDDLFDKVYKLMREYDKQPKLNRR
ncbi:F-box protein At3g07870-like [Silene latifolia]|uniref:F-box protein At3g07870-like n=1 Tax=Silene latifolia TaxID=37657 RepID=UPI003D785846